MNKCSKCSSKNVSWLDSIADLEEGTLCQFVCLDCNEIFMDIKEVTRLNIGGKI